MIGSMSQRRRSEPSSLMIKPSYISNIGSCCPTDLYLDKTLPVCSMLFVLNPNTPIDMPNLLEKQIKKGKSVSIFPIHEYWQDIGQINDYESANEGIGDL